MDGPTSFRFLSVFFASAIAVKVRPSDFLRGLLYPVEVVTLYYRVLSTGERNVQRGAGYEVSVSVRGRERGTILVGARNGYFARYQIEYCEAFGIRPYVRYATYDYANGYGIVVFGWEVTYVYRAVNDVSLPYLGDRYRYVAIESYTSDSLVRVCVSIPMIFVFCGVGVVVYRRFDNRVEAYASCGPVVASAYLRVGGASVEVARVVSRYELQFYDLCNGDVSIDLSDVGTRVSYYALVVNGRDLRTFLCYLSIANASVKRRGSVVRYSLPNRLIGVFVLFYSP